MASEDSVVVLNSMETTPLLAELQPRPEKLYAFFGSDIKDKLTTRILRYVPDFERYSDDSQNKQTTPPLLLSSFLELCILLQNTVFKLFAHLQEHSLSIAPVIAVGHLSTSVLAASTISAMVTSVTGYSLVQGFTSALDQVLPSRGASDSELASLWCKRTAFVTAISLVPIASIWFHAGPILLSLNQDPEVVTLVSVILRVSAISLPAYAFNEIGRRYLSSTGLENAHTRVLNFVAPINILLNYLLVNGPLSLGVIGAPVSTAVSYYLISAMLMLTIIMQAWTSPSNDDTVDRDIDATNESRANGLEAKVDMPRDEHFFKGMSGLVLAGFGGIGRTASQCWSKDMGALAVSMLGPNALASQAILLATATTAAQASNALNLTSSNRIRTLLQNGRTRQARIATLVSLLATLCTVVMIANVLLASAENLGKAFTSDPMVLQLVTATLPLVTIFQLFTGLGTSIDGALREFGKPATYPTISASADYCGGIPLGLWLAFRRGWGLSGLWAGLIVSLAYSVVVGLVVLMRSLFSSSSSYDFTIHERSHDPENSRQQCD